MEDGKKPKDVGKKPKDVGKKPKDVGKNTKNREKAPRTDDKSDVGKSPYSHRRSSKKPHSDSAIKPTRTSRSTTAHSTIRRSKHSKGSSTRSPGWRRGLSKPFIGKSGDESLQSFDVSISTGIRMLGLAWRFRSYTRSVKKDGGIPYMDPFEKVHASATMGVPCGGIGCGSITRGWQGDFARPQSLPCVPWRNDLYRPLDANQFSLWIRSPLLKERTFSTVLNTRSTNPLTLKDWNWKGLKGTRSSYRALYPRAWTTYNDFSKLIKLSCRQISPIIPHDYKTSSLPVCVFVWTLENTSSQPLSASIMLTFQNGFGGPSDAMGGHKNVLWTPPDGTGPIGIDMRHKCHSTCATPGGETKSFSDPMTISIATKSGCEGGADCVSTQSTFVASDQSGSTIWKDFSRSGKLREREPLVINAKGKSDPGCTIGAGMAARIMCLQPGERRQLEFAISWDAPVVRFGAGRPYFARYTKYYPQGRYGLPGASRDLVRDALDQYPAWEKAIEDWQRPILLDESIPKWYKAALFNELYFLSAGGSVWVDRPAPDDHYANTRGGCSPVPSSRDGVGRAGRVTAQLVLNRLLGSHVFPPLHIVRSEPVDACGGEHKPVVCIHLHMLELRKSYTTQVGGMVCEVYRLKDDIIIVNGTYVVRPGLSSPFHLVSSESSEFSAVSVCDEGTDGGVGGSQSASQGMDASQRDVRNEKGEEEDVKDEEEEEEEDGADDDDEEEDEDMKEEEEEDVKDDINDDDEEEEEEYDINDDTRGNHLNDACTPRSSTSIDFSSSESIARPPGRVLAHDTARRLSNVDKMRLLSEIGSMQDDIGAERERVRSARLSLPSDLSKLDLQPVLERVHVMCAREYARRETMEAGRMARKSSIHREAPRATRVDRYDVGQFAYLEGHEYLMFNTYDVHFYASFALVSLWPWLQISLQRDVSRATLMEDDEIRTMMASGKEAARNVKGAVPHDLGAPTNDPWYKVNEYNIHDVSDWKDLNSKFVLTVMRDYIALQHCSNHSPRCYVGTEFVLPSGGGGGGEGMHNAKGAARTFLEDMWPVAEGAVARLKRFDKRNEGMIENEGFPDQTYDAWTCTGTSAYCGGLWVACLAAMAEMASILGHEAKAKRYQEESRTAAKLLEQRLWNASGGGYYNYDSSSSSHARSIMADQLAGHWYTRSCGLPPSLDQRHVRKALRTVFQRNVRGVARQVGAARGAVNGTSASGGVDKTSLQSQEVWTGTTYALAACLMLEGYHEEAWETAHGVVECTYNSLGYWFQTPEAWTIDGKYRAIGYMRPLAIWSIQWAKERIATEGTRIVV